MIGIFGLLVVLASPAVAAPAPGNDTVRYTVAPVLADRVLTGLSVEIQFAGDLIRREAGTVGDSSVEVAYRVQDGDTERVIRYLPQGTAQVTFQRVLPAPEMAAQACEQRIRAVP